jgi:hypothetical protein
MFSPQKSTKFIKKSSKFGNDENHDGMLWFCLEGGINNKAMPGISCILAIVDISP